MFPLTVRTIYEPLSHGFHELVDKVIIHLSRGPLLSQSDVQRIIQQGLSNRNHKMYHIGILILCMILLEQTLFIHKKFFKMHPKRVTPLTAHEKRPWKDMIIHDFVFKNIVLYVNLLKRGQYTGTFISKNAFTNGINSK